MAYSEDHIALAAEYALGTLDAEERAQVETMMAVDKEFTALVQAWEYRLGALNQMVGSVEPRPRCGTRSDARSAMSAAPQAPLVLPEAPPPPTSACRAPRCRSAAAVASRSDVVPTTPMSSSSQPGAALAQRRSVASRSPRRCW